MYVIDNRCLPRYLQDNAIESLEGLERLPELEVLNVSNNRLTDLDPLSRCTKLATFLGANNDLADINGIKAISLCQYLATVDLQDNDLSDAQVTLPPLIKPTAKGMDCVDFMLVLHKICYLPILISYCLLFILRQRSRPFRILGWYPS